ncbi:MAG TPA: ABC transporter ATP-binding protein [Nocardioides sp.]|nr:ABC transporter ATP-binding protein [Nocardioides sp.]
MSVSPVLSVRDLHTVVGSRESAVPVVRGVSFDLHAGEAVALVGESGSGKSMSALSVTGLLPAGVRIASGSVKLAGRELTELDERERRAVRGAEIAMIYQDPLTSLNPLMRVGAQVAEGLQAHGMRREDARRRTVAALGEVGLPSPERLSRSYPHELSGGQRQRVMIAMAVALRPKVLIADEPTTALDVTIQQQVLALADDLRRSTGMALLWITHDLGVVARIAERVLVMYAGKVVESASTKQLYAKPQHPYTAGLLGSIPPLIGDERPELLQIGGAPAELGAMPTGCPYHPRCPQRVERCATLEPPLEPRAADSAAACWVPPERWVS